MIFIDPSLEEVYNTLIENDELINFLKEHSLLITKSSLYGKYTKKEIESMSYEIFTNNTNTLYDLAQVLLNNKEEIKSKSIIELLTEKIAWDDMAISLGIQPYELTSDIYKKIMYSYKYCTVSSFFQNNRDKFIPENDMFEIENNPAAEAFLDALMKEFDKLDIILGKCCEYMDYDKIPWDLITYLTQMLGYEKTTFNIKEEVKFRELAKNILDLYRMKGTGYSFELFFRFLGFNIKIREFYFDRRLYYLRTAGNLETSAINAYKNEYYLTELNPTNNELIASSINEVVLPSDISPQYSLNEFDELCEKYGPAAVLGYSPVYYTTVKKDGKDTKEVISHPYTDKVYKYFKTNLIYYEISLDKGNPTPEDYKTITKCLDFLTPSYITRGIKVETNTGETEEEMAFDGDGTKQPDSYGNFRGFDFLDSEDWSQEYINEYTVDENGKRKVLDPYGYTGIDNSINNPDGKKNLDDRYVDYYNSLVNKETNRVYKGSDFRLPIGYRLVNKSANRFLTGTSGKPAKIYNDYKRLKYLVIPKLKGESVPNGTPGAKLYPYYTIPPYVKDKSKWEEIPIKFEKETKGISLTGNKPDKDGNDEDTVKRQIKLAHLINSVTITDKSIDDYIQNDLSELSITKSLGKLLNKVASFSYENSDILSCYNKFIKNSYHISNIKKGDVNSIPNVSIIDNYNYIKYPDVYKNFVFGEYIIANDEVNKKLIVFLFSHAKIPVKQRGSELYNKEDYYVYLNSIDYDLVKPYNGSINKMGAVNLPDKIEVNNIKDAYNKIKKAKKEMQDGLKNGNLTDLGKIINSIYYVKSEREYYKPIIKGVETDLCIVERDCKMSHVFDSLELAKKHFENNPSDVVCNSEFFIRGNFDTWNPEDGLNKLETSNLYTFVYTKRVPGTLIYSINDKKLYILTGSSDYDYEELKDFFGRFDFYYKDINGNYHLENNIILENVKGKEYADKYSLGLSENINDMFAQIDLYDENWLGYDEQSDEEEFIFYNSPHLVKYIPGKCYEENGNELVAKRINRPIKALTDDGYNKDINKSFLENNNSIGQNIIKDICNKTIDSFMNNEINNWEMSYNEVPSYFILNLNPKELGLLEKSGNDYISTEDETFMNKKYYTKMTNGFLSIIERNIELLTQKSVEDRDYDYYSNVSNFLSDYYKIIYYNKFETENFPDKFVNDYPAIPAENTIYSDEQILEIKKCFSIIILQMGVLLNNLYQNKIFYSEVSKNSEQRWSIISSKKDNGVWIQGENGLKKYCPKLVELWINDPLLADPYNPIFFKKELEKELKNYFDQNNISDEFESYKLYYSQLSKDTQQMIATASDRLEVEHNGKKYYGFEYKTNFINYIRRTIENLNNYYGKECIDYLNINKDILNKDSKSSKWFRKYDKEIYYYKSSNGALATIEIDCYLSSDMDDYIFVPFVYNYGINKFSKDYYGNNKEIYSEFSELLSCFVNSLESGKDITDGYLKQILYNNLVNLYRESFMKDDNPIESKITGKRPMTVKPIKERFNGKAGTFFLKNTLMNSYINNGGKKDTDVRMKFNDFNIVINKEGKVILDFNISPKEFERCYGSYWNPYYNKGMKSINRKSGLVEEMPTEEVIRIRRKLFSCIRPYFYFTKNSENYYSKFFDENNNLTKWQRFRKFLSIDFNNVKVDSYDINGNLINNENGDIINEAGEIISNKELAFGRIKECIESGYIKITIESDEILNDLINEVPEINEYLDSNATTYMNILNTDSVDPNNDEKNFISGFLSVRKLNSKFIDNYLSFPESLKWIEVDENYMADEFSSFGDDRNIDIIKKFSYTSKDNIDSYELSNDQKNISIASYEGEAGNIYKSSKPKVISKGIINGEESIIPFNKCELVFDEEGNPALKVPFNIFKTCEATDISIIYDDNKTSKLKLTKRRKAVK